MEKKAIMSDQSGSSESESEEESDENTNPDEYSADSLYDPYNQKTTQVVFEYRSGRKVARLREPRDLYGVSSASFLQPPRWPHECEVLKERVQHIEWNPPAPEPMYKPTGLEQEPACKDPTNGKVIYLVNEGSKGPFFMCSRVGGNRSPLRQVAPLSCEASKTTLIFEARFESGNLQKVVQVGDYDYQLTLRTDLYTNRHIQWYYFRVKNTRAGVPYRFTIVNLMKPTSLYSHGMRPLMYSEVEASTRKIGWYRIGEEIKYYRNNLGQGDQSYFSLSWTFRFPHSMDTCYFAHCYPYTYSKLQDYLSDIASDPERSKYCKIRVLCHSLAGNIVYILTITNPSTEEPKKKKQAVVVTARVHPGETNSSWVMKGFLDYILSSRNDAFQLRDQFVFKVVPMLNPDGVIVGNYRCSLAGRDLNRNYKSRLKDSFPSIWFTRKMIKRVMEEREILLYCDLHGHSRKQNVFMYGCNGSQAKDRHLYERLFPLLLSKNSPEMFSFPACKFQVQKSKEGTGRVVMWKMGIRNSFTLEATFCGSTLGTRHGTHFSTKDLESVGAHFCDALLDYSDPEQTKCYLYLKELNEILKQRFVFNHEKAHLDSKTFLNDVLSDLDSSNDASHRLNPVLERSLTHCKAIHKDLSSTQGVNLPLVASLLLLPCFSPSDSSSRYNPPPDLIHTSGSDSSDSNGPPAHQMELATKFKPREKMLKSKRERNSHRKQLVLNIKQEQPGEDEATRRKTRELSAMTMELISPEKPSDSGKMPTNNTVYVSKRQKGHLFQDSDNKKVSVVYLVFDSKGEVITTKSHPCLQTESIMDISSTANGFRWNKPYPLLKSLLSQRFPLPRVLQQYCCYNLSTDNGGTPKSHTLNAVKGCESGEDKAVDKPVSFHVNNQAKYSHATNLCPSGMEISPGAVLLYHPVSDNLLLPAPYRARGSAPACTGTSNATELQNMNDLSGYQVISFPPRAKENHLCNSAPQNSVWSGQDVKDECAMIQKKKNLSLPAVTAYKGTLSGILEQNVLHPKAPPKHRPMPNILPKMVAIAGTEKSSLPSLPPSGELKGRAKNVTASNSTQGNILPHREVKETQHSKQFLSTWKDVLIGLGSVEASGPLNHTPSHTEIHHVSDTISSKQNLKQRTPNGFQNNMRKQGQRLSLSPLGNPAHNAKDVQSGLNRSLFLP